MLAKIFKKFNQLLTHYQVLFFILITLCAIMFTWGFEHLLDLYFFPNKPLLGYGIAVIGSLGVLFIIQHVIRHIF